MSIFIDAFRWILWMIIKAMFLLMDEAYNIVVKIATFSITDIDTLWNWWGLLCCFIAIFVFFRVIANYLRMLNDEEYRDKYNPFTVFVRIGIVSFVILCLPFGVKYVSDFTSDMIEQSQRFFVVENDVMQEFIPPKTGNEEYDAYIDDLMENYQGMPSYLLYSSAADGLYPPYQFIDINSSEGLEGWDKITDIPIIGSVVSWIFGGDGDYYYFPDTTSLLFLLVETVMGCFLLALISIEIAKRIFDIGLLILISPYPISGLVSEGEQSFSRWCKLLISDLMNNFIQIIFLKLVLVIVGSQQIEQLGVLARIVFLIGGLMCVLIGPSSIASLIGGDGMGTNQALQTLTTVGSLGHGLRSGASLIGGAAATVGALGIYGGGRMLGGRSLAGHDSTMSSFNSSGGGSSGISSFSSNSGFSSGNTGLGGVYGAGSNGSFDNESSVNPMDTSGGFSTDVSPMMESMRSDGGINDGLAASQSQSTFTMDGERMSATDFDHSSKNISGNTGGATFSSANAGITRQGSIANRVSQSNSRAAQTVSGLSSSLYVASANRLFGQKGPKQRKMQTASNIVHGAGHIIAPSNKKRN